jgi:hypothetical protein
VTNDTISLKTFFPFGQGRCRGKLRTHRHLLADRPAELMTPVTFLTNPNAHSLSTQ